MKLFFACLFLLTIVHGSLACSCGEWLSTEQRICNADFVVKAFIGNFVSTGVNDFDAHYSVSIKYIYRVAEGKSVNKSVNQLFTAGSGALCGLPDYNSGLYVVAGTVDPKGQLRLYLCSASVLDWKSMKNDYGVVNDKALEDALNDMCSK